MARDCHASHEVCHEGVAQRAHNSLTCAFRRCQERRKKFLPLLRHRFAEFVIIGFIVPCAIALCGLKVSHFERRFIWALLIISTAASVLGTSAAVIGFAADIKTKRRAFEC